MVLYALADFGSTFTKVALVDDTGTLLASAQHRTTVETDVHIGFVRARDRALDAAGLAQVDATLAASSAAGGLRMVAVGLVDDLTAAAAHRAALSAGARVTAVYSGALGTVEQVALTKLAPDVILFAGGTDGGERQRVLANATAIAQAGSGASVVVACNREVAGEVERVLTSADHETVVVDNVLPEIGHECSGPAREAIRELFIRHVVRARGMSEAAEFYESVLMPTPAAVLACAEVLVDGVTEWPGCGSAVIVDVGGATTDVHSVVPVTSLPDRSGLGRAASERSARTVEGDLGVRWNADTVVAQDGEWLSKHLTLSLEDLAQAAAARRDEPSMVPTSVDDRRIDQALAASCVTIALARHVGRLSTRYIPGEGAEVKLVGRDLRDARFLLVTGGSLVRDAEAREGTVRTAMQRFVRSQLVPSSPQLLVDHRYVLAAAGLLSSVNVTAALGLLNAELPSLAVRSGQ